MKVHRVEQITNEKWLNLYTAEFENKGHAGRWSYCAPKISNTRSTTPRRDVGITSCRNFFMEASRRV